MEEEHQIKTISIEWIWSQIKEFKEAKDTEAEKKNKNKYKSRNKKPNRCVFINYWKPELKSFAKNRRSKLEIRKEDLYNL